MEPRSQAPVRPVEAPRPAPAALPAPAPAAEPETLLIGGVKVTYERVVVTEIIPSFDDRYDTVTTTSRFPRISGMADREQEARINRFFMIAETTDEGNARVIAVRHLRHADSDVEEYSRSRTLVRFNEGFMSVADYDYLPGGARPMILSSEVTVGTRDLKPVSFDALFHEGYKSVIQQAVIAQVPFDSTYVDCPKPLQVLWLESIETMRNTEGFLLTDSALVITRDTEYDFWCPHALREFMQVSVLYADLRPFIRADGPLGPLVRP